MESRGLILCLFVCVFFAGVFGQVGTICRANERLLACGCPKTCRDPVPDCQGVCKFGCFCEEGQVRNDDGICVKLADCPKISAPYRLHSSDPRFHEDFCADDEEYRLCEPCNKTCKEPNPICPAQCSKGCFCKQDLLRDKDGSCVKFDMCSNYNDYIKAREQTFGEPISRFTCGPNKQYKECQKCTQSCGDAEPVCGKCKSGCVCKDGYVKGPDGRCIEKKHCPKGYMSGDFNTFEECGSDEEFLYCGWCEPTCQEPSPSCPAGCTSGCLCRPPLIRHESGRCVIQEQCGRKTCSDPNESYSCQYCERRCGSSDHCLGRSARRCILGCYCKRGFIRDEWNKCVTDHQCNNTELFV